MGVDKNPSKSSCSGFRKKVAGSSIFILLDTFRVPTDAFWQVLGEYLGGKVVKERMGMAWVIMADTCYPSCFNHEVHNIKPCHGNAWFMLFQKVGTTPVSGMAQNYWHPNMDKNGCGQIYQHDIVFFRGFRCLRDSSTSKTWGRPGRCSFSTTRNVQPEILPYIFLADAWAFFVTSAWCWNNQPLPLVFKPLGVQPPINYVLVIII